MLNFLTLFLAFQAVAYAQLPQPIRLDSAEVTGTVDGDLIKYLGIPFANAPRFNLPQPVPPYRGSIAADTYRPGCIKQNFTIPPGLPIPPPTGEESEDCLFLNIIKPIANVPTVMLPVVVWIFGGGFQTGSASQPIYDTLGKSIVSLSVGLQKPVIYVSMNYRLSAYGFLASEEVAKEGIGNFGLHDQRAALHWVKKYIGAFGGDPSRVTLWGQSSGAISAALQMTAYVDKAENLFQGVFMQSGAPIPVGPLKNGQKYYDDLVNKTNCTTSSYNTTLECLRHVDLDLLKTAVNESPGLFDYEALHLAWLPRVDGDFIPGEPFRLVQQGKFVDVPTVSGTCDDEGTVFSLGGPSNISTDADFQNYVRTVWAPDAEEHELLSLWTNYTSIPSEGSPFGEPNDDPPYPQYNRIAAFQNDIVFQSSRRLFTKALSLKTQKAWVYLSKRFKTLIPVLGSFHGSDMLLGNFTHIYVVNFANHFDPNTGKDFFWPPYNTTGNEIYSFVDQGVTVAKDDYRIIPIKYLTKLALTHPL